MEVLRYEKVGRIVIITIDRPEARNAINAEVAVGVEAALDMFEADDESWVGVLVATPPVFCAGADLKELRERGSAMLSTRRGGFAGIVARERTKSLIAAVDGPAFGGGTEVALACDLIVASRSTHFGMPEVKRGRVAGGGGLFRLPNRIPLNAALQMLLTGDPIDAERAYELGLVASLAEPGHAGDVARRLAERIAENAPVAVRASLRAARRAATEEGADAWGITAEAREVASASQDCEEGLRAFVEKRMPVWSGR